MAVPLPIPVTIPDALPMVTIDVLLLDHVPYIVVLVIADVALAQIELIPEMAAGAAFTVNDFAEVAVPQLLLIV